MPTLLDRLRATLYLRPTRRLVALPVAPPLERRGPQVAAEDYAARNLIGHTLDRKADLRRLAPTSADAAARYRELLSYELAALRDVARVLQQATGGPDLATFLQETEEEITRLAIEVEWCDRLLQESATGRDSDAVPQRP